MVGSALGPVNGLRVPERFREFRQGSQPAWRKRARHFGNVRRAQNVQQGWPLPVRRRRVVEDDLLDPFVEQRRIKREDSHFAFAVNRNGGAGKFPFIDGPIHRAQDVPHLHRGDGAAHPGSGAFDIRVFGCAERFLGKARIEDEHRVTAEQREQFIRVHEIDRVARPLRVNEQWRVRNSWFWPEQLGPDSHPVLTLE